jgi:hypothetical protein
MKYILDKDRNVVPVDDVLTWGHWFDKHRKERIVEQTYVGKVKISTVFLGLDHNFMGLSQKPVVFETMVFGEGGTELETERCSTWREAEDMHARHVWAQRLMQDPDSTPE